MSDGTHDDRRIARESGKLSALTMISRVLGLIRDRTRGSMMGTGGLADSFTVAFSVPNLFRRLFAEGSMAVAFIPTVKAYLSEKDAAETKAFLSATYTALTLCVCAVTALGIALSPLLVGLFRAEPAETALLMRMMFPFLALVSMAAFFQGILNSYGSFTPSGFAPILFNLSFILVPMAIGAALGNPARAMAVGVLVGGALQAACQLPALLKLGVRFGFVSPRLAFSNPGMKRVLGLIAPTVLGMAAYEVNGLVSTSLATKAGTGAATALSFSLRLQELVLGVFVVSVGTVLLPVLSELAAEARWDEYRDRLARSLKVIALITIPVAAISIIERVDIVSLLFKTREFGDASVAMTAGAFLFHMMGLPFIGANRILAPAFYARRDTKTPTWAGIVAVGVNVAAAVALEPALGGAGIALALTLASAVNTSLLLWRLSSSGVAGIGSAFVSVGAYAVKLLVFSAIAGAPVIALATPIKALFGASPSNLVANGLPFAISAALFAAVGIGLLAATKDSGAAFLVASFSRSSKRRSNSEE